MPFKSFLRTLAGLLVVAALSACGGDDSAPPSTPNPPNGPTTPPATDQPATPVMRCAP